MGDGHDAGRRDTEASRGALKRLCVLLCFFAAPAHAWWCEGHEVIALIARDHLTPAASSAVNALLRSQPIDSSLRRFCQNRPDDPMADASTWADDVKTPEQTGTWHYMDIPLSLKHGDPELWCKPVGPADNGRERTGCILSALRYNLNILHNEKESDAERAKALRYLIHLVGDLHQPLHTTADNDQGGNCTPVRFLETPKLSNLHSVWDGMIFDQDLAASKSSLAETAKRLDQKFAAKSLGWTKHGIDFDRWAWEGHLIAQGAVYGNLEPKFKAEPFVEAASCKEHAEKYEAVHLQISQAYLDAAEPVVEQQIVKAGYRLAEVLNQIW